MSVVALGSRPTRDDVRRTVAGLLDEPAADIGDGDDLMTMGLDSMGIMSLANGWRRDGMDVTFAGLVARPTLASWFAQLSDSADTAVVTAAPVPDVDEAAPHELSAMQRAYWIGRANGQPLGAVGSHFYFEFDGVGVDPARLDLAVRSLTVRHPMLRTRFLDDGRQQVTEGPRGLGGVHDLRARPVAEVAVALTELREQLSHQRMDIAHGQVFDVRLSQLPGGATRVHVDVDMLVCDALSFRLALADLAALYDHPHETLPPIGYSYPRYLADRARRPDRPVDREYWQAELATLPGAPQLPLAATPEQLPAPRTVRRHGLLDREGIAGRAREYGITLSLVLATAFAEVVAAWSAEKRFLLNLPLFDREITHPDVPALVGDFTNLVLLAVDATAEESFLDRARRVQRGFRSAAAHSGYAGTDVLRDLTRAHPDTPASAPVVFTSALNMGELFTAEVRDALGEPAWMSSQTAGVWLDLQVVEHDNGLLLNWESVDELFPAGVQDAMFAAFVALVDRLAAPNSRWEDPLARLPLAPQEQLQVRERVNATATELPEGPLHGGFFELARRTPDAPALMWGADHGMTYGELAARALVLAGRLRAVGVGAGQPVALTLPKGPDQVVAVLGVLAAGGAYVPVGIDQPARRRSRIYRRCGARVLVTGAGAGAGADETGGLRVLDIAGAAGAHTPPAPVPVTVAEDELAYVIYTSGSTGEPKGVEITHRAARNTVEAINARFALGAADRVLAVSALDFDLSVYDMFGPLTSGGAVVCVAESERRDAHRWVTLINERGVTVLNCVPALLDMVLVAAEEARERLSLRLTLLGGDWVGLDLPGRVARQCRDCTFVALGGTTEAAVHSTVCEVGEVPDTWHSIPYGFPLPNQRCRVVDTGGRDCPDWVPGELWIGGTGVARGYRGDPERTAARFVAHAGERWYRTGDLARYWPDGSLEFLGRADFQVKVNGHRIELGEIETALRETPGVLGAVAVTVGGGGARLAAMVAAGHDLADPERLRYLLATRVPGYMVPDRIVVVDALPLSANGKIDRKAVLDVLADLPAEQAAEFAAPGGEVEIRLAALWSDLLDVPAVGRHDSFFALGGDSLRATRLLTRLGATGLHGADLGALFTAPTLAAFAATLRPGAPARQVTLAADPAARHDPFPATDVQRAYWLGRSPEFTLGGVGSYWYWEFDGADVDVPLLEAMVNRLVGRHEMLRAVFGDDGTQRILPEVPHFRVPVEDAESGQAHVRLAELRAAMSHRTFDVGRWPLFDIRAVRHGDRTRIAFGFDYIVLDALSIMIIFWELSALYRNPDATLPSIGVSFRDYQLQARPDPRARAEAEEYWLEQARTLPPAPQLPLAVEPARVATPRFSRREFTVPAPMWQALSARASRHDLTRSTVLAAAFAEVLATWSTRHDIALNLTLFDRREVHPDINNILGDFTSLLLVGHHARAGVGWATSARELQQQVWSGLRHGSVSAIWVLRELAKQAGVAEVLMPVVFTSTLGVSDKLAELSVPFGDQVHGLSQTPQVSIDCQVVERDGGLAINWDVVDELFPAGLVDAMFDAYRALVGWLSTSDWLEPAPPLLPAAQARVRERVNATHGPESGALLHQGFFAVAASTPLAIALRWGADGSQTYGELADRALRVAGALVANGVTPGDLVAVNMPKGAAQIAAVLGVLAAGGVYVPIGAEQPAARRDLILRTAGVTGAVTAGSISDWPAEVQVVDVARAERTEPLIEPVTLAPEDLAYVIFTSGSTGEPKGVEITHRSAMNTIDDVNRRFAVTAADRVLALSALDFDLSVYDVFGLLSAGGSLVLVDEGDRREARVWAGLVRTHGVTVWNTVPALLDMLLTSAGEDLRPESLRLAMVSGDWVGLDLPGRLAAAAPDCAFVALGGATEGSIWSNAFEVTDVAPHWRSVPYGHPLRNQEYRVVDPRGHDCPDWVPGELWIGGVGVAGGYRGDRARTEAKFVEHRGLRWYRTGDLGRYWPDGTLEFLGRADFQVKINGHRIELGEIEAALTAHPAVLAAVAGTTGVRAARRLTAFAVTTGDAGDLREFLAGALPAYMIPDRVTLVDSFPLSANGKVDRAALAELAGGEPAVGAHEPPRTPVESELAALWADLLDLPIVHRGDSFFALGGDSLLATTVVEIVRERFGPRLSLRQLFTAPTVAELAALLERERDAAPPIDRDSVEEGVL